MELKEIQIKNFRSIKEQTIIVEHNCLILLGKNEAGKSNILKAIASVFGEYTVSAKDKRKRIENEVIKENDYYVRAVIKLLQKDFNEILNHFNKQYTNTDCISFKNEKTLSDFIKTVFYNLLICIDIAENKKNHFSYWSYNKNDFELENEIYLNVKNFNTAKQGTKQEISNIESIIFDVIKELYNENPYICHYWKYSDDYLLPGSIAINDFTINPDKFKPLKNIFVLCNRPNITQEFADAKSQDGHYRNLLKQVSQNTTKEFRKIWEIFKNTSITLEPDGNNIAINIEDKVLYSFEDRSDGFKKIISILLMLSTQSRSNEIGEQNIILIDEPDQSLYPTSARNLRDELLRIAKTAKVVYTTHSTYMIDSDCIDRHLIVEKNNDITTIKKQNTNAEHYDDELLRNAIGASIFEIIKPKNIIFEGWLDKELFNKYCNFNKIKKNNNNVVGITHLDGIKKYSTLVQLLVLANKKFIIVSDSDAIAKENHKKFKENYEEYASCWLEYGEIISDVLTMEDFISTDFIKKYLKKEYPNFKYNDTKNVIKNIDEATKDDKENKSKIKKDIVNTITKKDVTENYSTFINELIKKIEE